MSHTVNDLRDHLFATISALRDKDDPMPIDRAKAIADVAQTVINSAKVEVDMINAVGPRALPSTGFMAGATDRPALEHDAGVAKPRNGTLPPTGPTARP